jgi:hypothetical protein
MVRTDIALLGSVALKNTRKKYKSNNPRKKTPTTTKIKKQTNKQKVSLLKKYVI